jgi:hypothetical protein|tara:strand:- start:368 stop:496 length:129 start_codon:yes stop_codon:yes gene_type:complete
VEQVDERDIKKIAHSLGRIAYALEIIAEELLSLVDERNTQED